MIPLLHRTDPTPALRWATAAASDPATAQLGPVQIIAIIAGTVTVIGFLRLLLKGIYSWWKNTWGSRWALARKLERLELGVSGALVTELLGTPTVVEAVQLVEDSKHTVKRYLTRYAWVSTLVDEADAVLAISVSTSDPRLRFDLDRWSLGQLRGRLGRVRFADAGIYDQYPEYVGFGVGANRFYYAEAFYFGNPAMYRTFRLSSNDGFPGGADWIGAAPRELRRVGPDDDMPPLETLQQIRKSAVVNTITVLKSGYFPDVPDLRRAGAVTEIDWGSVVMIRPGLPPEVELYHRLRDRTRSVRFRLSEKLRSKRPSTTDDSG